MGDIWSRIRDMDGAWLETGKQGRRFRMTVDGQRELVIIQSAKAAEKGAETTTISRKKLQAVYDTGWRGDELTAENLGRDSGYKGNFNYTISILRRIHEAEEA